MGGRSLGAQDWLKVQYKSYSNRSRSPSNSLLMHLLHQSHVKQLIRSFLGKYLQDEGMMVTSESYNIRNA